jgi:hypothetical protein
MWMDTFFILKVNINKNEISIKIFFIKVDKFTLFLSMLCLWSLIKLNK